MTLMQGILDKLLDGIQLEMHATEQSGGLSPKSLSGPASSQQLKSSSDSVQNTGTSVPPPQGRGKKRNRIEQGPGSIKRVRVLRTDSVDCSKFRIDCSIKTEIGKITDRGGLISTDSVQNTGTPVPPPQGRGKKRNRIEQGPGSIKRVRVLQTDGVDCSKFRIDRSIKTEIGKITDRGRLVSTDSVQNTGTSVPPPQGRGKKRNRIEQGPESIKRVRVLRTDGVDCSKFRIDRSIKTEIGKITDRGGLISTVGVEKLLNLMQHDRTERKMDLAAQVLFADVIAATENIDCLERFLHLRGVLLLDNWLQEANKHKIGNGHSPKEIGNSENEELLSTLLRALDKLPVNLHALQTSNIGKSVNNLRYHKNLEIQKKARSLVDTWKKRVGAEMTKNDDGKSTDLSQAVSCSGKPSSSEISSGVARQSGSSEVILKSSTIQPSTCKSLPNVHNPGEEVAKTNTLLGTSKSESALCSKNLQWKPAGASGTAEMQLSSTMEEKSNKTSQSLDISRTQSGDHAKSIGSSFKDDAKSSIAGSTNADKSLGSHYRRNGSGSLGNGAAGNQNENSIGKSGSLIQNLSSSKLSSEEVPSLPVTDHGNNPRLIIKFPNPRHSLAQAVGGSSLKEMFVRGSKSLSPGVFEERIQNDRKVKLKKDKLQANLSSCVREEPQQDNITKGAIGSDKGEESPRVLDEEYVCIHKNVKTEDAQNPAFPCCANEKAPLAELKSVKSYEPSVSSMNALSKSCARYSEVDSYSSDVDDTGMNLFASVATEVNTNTDLISPAVSPVMPATEFSNVNEDKARSLKADIANEGSHCGDAMDVDSEEQSGMQAIVKISIGRENLANSLEHMDDDGKSQVKLVEKSVSEIETAEGIKPTSVSAEDEKGQGSEIEMAKQLVENLKTEVKNKVENHIFDENKNDLKHEKIADVIPTSNLFSTSLGNEGQTGDATSGKRTEKEAVERSQTCIPVDMEVEKPTAVNERSNVAIELDLTTVAAVNPRFQNNPIDLWVSSDSCLVSSKHPAIKYEKSNVAGRRNLSELCGCEKKKQASLRPATLDQSSPAPLCSSLDNDDSQTKAVPEHHLIALVCDDKPPPEILGHETQQCAEVGSKLPSSRLDEVGKNSSSTRVSAIVALETENSVRFGFDLNEGVTIDKRNHPAQTTIVSLACSSAELVPNLAPSTVSSVLNSFQVQRTVASPAKGSLFPPSDLLKSKGEAGWKGSGATSAFRPAEPRKTLDMSVGTSETPSLTYAENQSRPPFDIDLNVPDERTLEDVSKISTSGCSVLESVGSEDTQVRIAGGLDLDLNKVDEGADTVQLLASSSKMLEPLLLPVRPATGVLPSNEVNNIRDFDLNNGPALDEVGVQSVQRNLNTKTNGVPFLNPKNCVIVNDSELGNTTPSSWFPPGNPYSSFAIPLFLRDRGDQSYPVVAAPGTQRYLGSATGDGSLRGDPFRDTQLSSSATTALSPSAFPYASFPIGSSFPLASTVFSGRSTVYIDSSSGGGLSFPTVSSQIVGPAIAASSTYLRPYVISLPDTSTNAGGLGGGKKWGRQCLDLNVGPGRADKDGRDSGLSSARQWSAAGSLVFAEEQGRIYQMVGGGLKRKETEGSWDSF